MPDNGDAGPSLDSALDSMFSAAGDSGTTDSVDTTSQASGLDTQKDAGSTGEVTDASVDETLTDPVDGDEEEDWTEEEANKTAKTEDGKHRTVPERRFKNLHRVYRQAKDIEAALGNLPSPEEAKQYADKFADHQLMQADMLSGDLDRVGRFVDHWTNGSEDALPMLIDRSVELLKSTAPEKYAIVQNTIAEEMLDGMYSKAAAMKAANDPNYKNFLYGVQMFDYNLTENYREVGELKAPDPLSEREDRVRQSETRQRETLSQQDRNATEGFKQDVSRSIAGQRTSAIDDALKPLAASYESKPTMFTAIKKDLAEKAVAAMQGDKVWRASHQALYEKAIRERTRTAADSVVASYSNRFKRAVNGLRAGVMKEATGGVVASNQASHEKLAAAAGKREPAGGGSPTNQLNVDVRYKEAKEKGDFSAAFDTLFA